jgi:predicted  nucleic acid-binding Zn-ribbon protein
VSPGPLQDLLAVQDVDLAVDRQRHRRRTLPERAELEGLDVRISAARAELRQTEAGRDEIAGRQGIAEAELAAAESRGQAVSRRLYGGEVSASRELQAMATELDQLKARASDLEDTVLGLLDEREPLDARIGELGAELARLADDREAAAAKLAEAESVVDAELAGLAARRQEAAASVPAELLATYERLRTRLGGVGVARVVGNHCDGCHLALSAAELDHLRHLPDGEVYMCEQCSRILVPS